MKRSTLAFLALLTLLSAPVSAAVITLETRGINQGLSSNLMNSFNNQTSTVTSSTLSSFSGIRIGNHSIGHLNVSTNSALGGTWLIDAGLDAGHGAELYVNGALIEKRTDDLWWRYDWNNSDVLSASANLVSGANLIDLYWAENCCNGYSSGRFSYDGGNSWLDLSVANIDAAAGAATVSEPSTLALLGLCLLGMVRMRKAS